MSGDEAGTTTGREASGREAGDERRQGDRADVLVIGAGLAGLAAAEAIAARSELRVVVLEAAERIGGRVRSEFWEPCGDLVELGATWVVPAFTSVLAALDRHGIGTVRTPDPALALTHFATGVQPRRRMEGLERDALAAFRRDAEAYVAEHPGCAAEEVLGALSPYPVIEGWVRAMTDYLAGAPLDEVDGARLLFDWDELVDPELHRMQVSGTTAALAEALAASASGSGRVRIVRDAAVVSMSESGDGVEARTGDGRVYRAAEAAVCLPLNVLRTVSFAPGLPDALARLADEGHAGRSRKEWLVVENAPQSFRVLSAVGPYSYLRSLLTLPGGRLLAVGFGAAHTAVGPSEVQAALKRYLPGSRVVARTCYDWNASPWSAGAWSTTRPGQPALIAARQDAGRLSFAGSDLAKEFTGSMEGALRSGLAAAERILARSTAA